MDITAVQGKVVAQFPRKCGSFKFNVSFHRKTVEPF